MCNIIQDDTDLYNCTFEFTPEEFKRRENIDLYQILPLKYAIKILLNDTLRLQPVKSWDDKYELFLFKQNYSLKGSSVTGFDAIMSRLYGQCWSLSNNEEFKWRIYGNGDPTMVRIHTTLGKLCEVIKKELNNNRFINLGKVEYYDASKRGAYINKVIDNKLNGEDIQKSLFIKRDCYAYENEVRVIEWLSSEPQKVGCKWFKPTIKAYTEIKNDAVKTLIDTIEFSPLVDNTKYKQLKNTLVNQLNSVGKNNIEITRSDIYDSLVPENYEIKV
ncbi:MAG: DUF2971 domain-containing protein [bacterium]|nr:DUF2971 domain-containing protein [bacterium]